MICDPGKDQRCRFMMAVDFCDYFWGEKHDGFNVIYQVLCFFKSP